MPTHIDEGALSKAQLAFFDALEVKGVKKRMEAMRSLLEISPFCVDALVYIAEHSRMTTSQRIIKLEEAVKAGETAIGKKEFKELAGEFWGWLETRPYMRARWSLATELWEDHQRDKAISHAQDMLRLNPNDNQGVRYELILWLFEESHWEELDVLLNEYPDEYSLVPLWIAPLLAFKQGNMKQAKKALTLAYEYNPFMYEILVENQTCEFHNLPYIQCGSKEEAEEYATLFQAAWKSVPDALAWLKSSPQ